MASLKSRDREPNEIRRFWFTGILPAKTTLPPEWEMTQLLAALVFSVTHDNVP
jgi:hypothetical protein